jgi:ankyrin repeat protein
MCFHIFRGYGAFHHACMGGDLQLVESLASRGGPGMPDLTGQQGGVVLNLACQAGHARVAEWLLKNKVRDAC